MQKDVGHTTRVCGTLGDENNPCLLFILKRNMLGWKWGGMWAFLKQQSKNHNNNNNNRGCRGRQLILCQVWYMHAMPAHQKRASEVHLWDLMIWPWRTWLSMELY